MKGSMMVLDHSVFSYLSVAKKTFPQQDPEKASNVFEAFEAVFMEL